MFLSLLYIGNIYISIIQPDCLMHYNNDSKLRSFLYFFFRLFTVAKWHSRDDRFVKFKADVSGLKPLFFIHLLRVYFFLTHVFHNFHYSEMTQSTPPTTGNFIKIYYHHYSTVFSNFPLSDSAWWIRAVMAIYILPGHPKSCCAPGNRTS